MEVDSKSSERSGRLCNLYRDVLNGKRQITGSRDAGLFLEAFCDHDQPATRLEQLTGNTSGLDLMHLALRADLSPQFLTTRVLPFLRYISAPSIKAVANGDLLRKLLKVVTSPSTLWSALFSRFKASEIPSEHLYGFMWLAFELLSDEGIVDTNTKSDIALIAHHDQVREASEQDVRDIGYRLRHILEIRNVPGQNDDGHGPGGRHDNDFVDFRKIRIYPTRDEMSSKTTPFYMTADQVQQAETSDRVRTHIDNQFRLLREDMLAELRHGLQAIKNGGSAGGRKSRTEVLGGLVPVGVDVGDEGKRRFKTSTLAVRCYRGLEWLGRMSKTEREDYVKKENNFLRDQSFGALCCDEQVLAFAFTSRNTEYLAQSPPVVMLRFADSHALQTALMYLHGSMKATTNVNFVLVDAPVFAYEPVLKGLQNITEMPLQESLFDGSSSVSAVPPASAPLQAQIHKYQEAEKVLSGNEATVKLRRLNSGDRIEVDLAQIQSIIGGLTQCVSVIQGPPGTGKSYIGAEIARNIHSSSQQRILVLSYTNHALNQYLEDLLDAGIPSDEIVRIGSQAKCTSRVLPLLLSFNTRGKKLGHNSWTNIHRLEQEATELVQQINTSFTAYKGMTTKWKQISEFLEFALDDYEFYEALQTPADSGEWKRVNKHGKQISPDYVFDRWLRGQDAGVFKSVMGRWSAIWEMSKQTRQAHRDRWIRAMLGETVERFIGSVVQFDNVINQIENYFKHGEMDAIGEKRVIGLTTTGAAKYSHLLRAFKPDVVIAEEAGEILESHILTAMSSTVKQLVLIGDHKQLRPKVNNYDLSVELGKGFDLNRSLFERLILQGMPHTVLRKQHRMAPDLSVYARELTYPELLDAPKTHEREPPRGLCNRFIFVHHESPEHADSLVTDKRDQGNKGSISNDFEAHMVMRCLRYMVQQGYAASQLVILTPYLGQLRMLSDLLTNNKHEFRMSDRDRVELLQAGLLTQHEAIIEKKPVRISTIDNYQGEESDIVIASLTRSNPRGNIGFMAAPERLNVLITRARNGMVLFGNMSTFMASTRGQTTWHRFFNMLKSRGCLYGGLPVKCEQHPERTALLKEPSDFAKSCPDGGCTEECNASLACGIHKCTSRCHRVEDHTKAPCNQLVHKTCDRSHKTQVPCHRYKDTCHECVREDEAMEKQIRRDLDLEAERAKRQAAYSRELAEIQAELDHEKRVIKYAAEEEDQKAAIAQQKADLEALQQTRDNVLAQKQRRKMQEACKDKSKSGATSNTDSGEATGIENASQQEDSAMGEWVRMKKYEGARSEAIDKLMGMIGLEEVKKEFLGIKTKVDTSLRQGVSLATERLSCSLLGNPGTGKTTVARLYAKFLTSVGVIPGTCFEETTGSSLANKGVTGCRKILDHILENGGGVLLIDEAYQLSSGNNAGGSGVLDFLLAEVENHRGKIVFILAGYSRQMESFFSHNPGIPSRFPVQMQFDDYTDDELLRILNKTIGDKFKGQMVCEAGDQGLYCRIVARRIGYGRGRDGFGNARAVENSLTTIHKRQGIRLRRDRSSGRQADDFLFTMEDLLGPAPDDVLTKCEAWVKLQELLGLQAVKEAIRSLMDSIRENYQRELEEKPRVKYSLNKVFLGNPGTGKTTVAKLYGKLLVALGLLTKGEVVVKTPADFVGAVIGGSEQQTKGILAASQGKVLVIDEAYGLYGGGGGSSQGAGPSDSFKAAVIDTIVAEVQSVPGDDRCVLLLGYKDQMETMLQNVNPGLSRRFPLSTAFVFEDFSDSELSKILDMKLKNQGYRTTGQGLDVAGDILQRARNRPNFGNAGEIDIMLDAAKQRQQMRRTKNRSTTSGDLLEAVDFDPEFDRAERAETNICKLFEGTVGTEDIVELLSGYQTTVKSVKAIGLDPKDSITFAFLFRGPPGTGKTTTARKMGKVFFDMGFLATADVHECSATDLVGQYTGHTGPKVQQMLDKAMGRVLFIDEAYRLSEGTFCREAVDELVDCLTKDRYHKKLIVILAGYANEINKLMAANPGLSSRFPGVVDFRAFSVRECVELLQKLLVIQQQRLKANNIDLDLTALSSPTDAHVCALEAGFGRLVLQDSWANARDVETIAKGIFSQIVNSKRESDSCQLRLTEVMVTTEICRMYEERESRAAPSRPSVLRQNNVDMTRFAESSNAPPAHRAPTSYTTQAKAPTAAGSEESVEDTEVPDLSEEDHEQPEFPRPAQHVKRDAGVSDEVWEQLKRDQEAEQDTEEELQRSKQRAKDARGAAREALLRRILKEEEERKRKAEMQKKLMKNGLCPVGYHWIPQADGFRCAGGSHFVSLGEANKLGS